MFMTGTFRAGHNKPRPRNRPPFEFETPRSRWRKKVPLLALTAIIVVAAAGWTMTVNAHPVRGSHVRVLAAPIAGVRNNHWYDYRSDVEEAEIELRKDLRRAKSDQDKREAWAEYHQELRDARKDYTKEMVEKGYILRPRGEVVVGD
jgi:hypothetical protein